MNTAPTDPPPVNAPSINIPPINSALLNAPSTNIPPVNVSALNVYARNAMALNSLPGANALASGQQGGGDTVAPPVEPAKPPLNVSYENGMLSIHSYRATLSQVLYEVHLKTQAEVGIPAGAEREEVIVDLGPGPARDVLGALLNGSPYNFIFVGNERTLERVILTRRDSGVF
jgi:hypothetical protein